MRVKIGKYWAEDMELNPRMNRILYIAVVLDPRQKMNHVETCFKSIIDVERKCNEDLSEELANIGLDEFRSVLAAIGVGDILCLVPYTIAFAVKNCDLLQTLFDCVIAGGIAVDDSWL
ncbi:hypothetical protein AAHA92_08682 [Salvia divinorum]|uniref:hAT-like transposase RNase-H fold domain-containing protein n=1 Tax=Salvia divinorum TaxID=28513 RepID=A0ABD1HP09_SALDI